MHALDTVALTLLSALALTACGAKSTASEPNPDPSDTSSERMTTVGDNSTATPSTPVHSDASTGTPTGTVTNASTSNQSNVATNASTADLDPSNNTSLVATNTADSTNAVDSTNTVESGSLVDAGSNVLELDAGANTFDTGSWVALDAALHGRDDGCLALPLSCGAHFEHSTSELAGPNVWNGYNSSARAESGKEVLYFLPSEAECDVSVELSQLNVDLDLFLLTACDPLSSTQASSTPLDLQTVERLEFSVSPGEVALVAVDGYDDAEGGYTLDVLCDCK